ncbi:MAG: AbrB/MazE/SpoVT family DNA-binding domain-containing protein [Proteobacteria bacterium]|nr:AbrB/MazE/SpoVT family DNA-binding domain-containing protein [Pseudomonadota bacterium]
MKAYAITPKGQVTIPVSVREELNLKPGDRIIYEKSSGGILIKPAKKNMLDDFGFMKSIEVQKIDLDDIRKAVRKKIAGKRS